METNTNQQKVVDAEIISTENHSSKYGSQLTVVEKDFATLFEGSDMKKHLSSLKRKYSGLKVKDVNDTETYEEIKKAISVVRPLRTAMDKKRKEVNKEAKSFIDSVNDMGAKIQAEIAKIEDPLWSEREKFENLQKEEAERAEKVAKEKLDNRVSELISNGIVFTGMWYGIGQIQVGIQMIQEMSDDDYNDLLSKVKVQNDLNISEQKRKDEEAQAEKEKQETLRKENEAKQKALQEQEDALNAKLKAIADQEKAIADKLKAQKELEEKQALEAKQKAEDELVAMNAKQYEGLGFKYSFQHKLWTIQIGTYHSTITREMVLANEESTYHRISTEVSTATQKENERLAQEELARQAKIKSDAEEIEKKRRELLDDTEKFNEYISALSAIEPPLLNNKELRDKVKEIIKAINQ